MAGSALRGELRVSRSKNSALAVLAATLLCDETVVLAEVPDIADVRAMLAVLRSTGCTVNTRPHPGSGAATRVEVQAGSPTGRPDPAAVASLRGGFFVLGPLLARAGSASLPLPGGCAIGPRPVDIHLEGLEAMGASFSVADDGMLLATTTSRRGLTGASLRLRYPSVGATEVLMMAACLADGTTTIRNAAMEPEVEDLAAVLRAMGAHVAGAGGPVIVIEGLGPTGRLRGVDHDLMPDRIEAGTFMAAAALLPGSRVVLRGVVPAHLRAASEALRATGCTVRADPAGGALADVQVCAPPAGAHRPPLELTTAPHPAFPTDLQPQFTVLATQLSGRSRVLETVFAGRMGHAEPLARMGARVEVQEVAQHGPAGGRCNMALVWGPTRLKGADVDASDLRQGAALLLAGVAAEGVTVLRGLEHVDRGYAGLEAKLAALGVRAARRQRAGGP